MGIDYYTCQSCSENFPDCGVYETCGYCCRQYCGEKLKEKHGFFEEDEDELDTLSESLYKEYYDPRPDGLKRCDFCTMEKIDDKLLIEFLLKKYKTTRKKAEKEIKEKYTISQKTKKLVKKE